MELTFEKEENNNWYVVLPEWTGSKDDLQMVSGADTMLDIIANGNKSVLLDMDLVEFENSTHLELMEECDKETGGGEYFLKEWEGRELNLDIWLCDVTKFVFGFLPDDIYFKKIPQQKIIRLDHE